MILLTIKEAAEYLRVHPMTMYRLVWSNKIRCIKFGGSRRIIKEEIESIFLWGVGLKPSEETI